MRLTDDRYFQQRLCLEVALRMIRFEARTSTIREATGISCDRIRKLHRTYLHENETSAIRRKRGKAPQSTYALTRNLSTRIASVLLAGVLQSTGTWEQIRSGVRRRIDITTVSNLCDAYELFLNIGAAMLPTPYSFEQAWCLIRALRSGVELNISTCVQCSGLRLVDIYSPQLTICAICESKRIATKGRITRRRRTSKRSASNREAPISGCISSDARRSP